MSIVLRGDFSELSGFGIKIVFIAHALKTSPNTCIAALFSLERTSSSNTKITGHK